MITARMRSGASWHDVCILNVSLHGCGIQSAELPQRGTYVEICRGAQTIIARVVWLRGHQAGLRSQDAIFIGALVNDNARSRQRDPLCRPIEQRKALTAEQQHERSRRAGRVMEFACLTLLVGAMSVIAFGAVRQVLAAPLSKISAALF